MTPEALAALHARCFGSAPRPWSAAEFADLIALPETLLRTAPQGFALGRVIGPEAEILTIAVAPEARRRGIAAALLAALEAEAADRGAEEAFLEVAETNGPARALYAAAGYDRVGCRPRYYATTDGTRADALILRKALGPPGPRPRQAAFPRKIN